MDLNVSKPADRDGRKPYETPAIKELGNLTDLTAQFEVSVIGH